MAKNAADQSCMSGPQIRTGGGELAVLMFLGTAPSVHLRCSARSCNSSVLFRPGYFLIVILKTAAVQGVRAVVWSGCWVVRGWGDPVSG